MTLGLLVDLPTTMMSPLLGWMRTATAWSWPWKPAGRDTAGAVDEPVTPEALSSFFRLMPCLLLAVAGPPRQPWPLAEARPQGDPPGNEHYVYASFIR